MAIIGHEISSNMFVWYGGNACADISDFNATTQSNLIGLLYDDACDEGFVMVSERTGKRFLSSTKIVLTIVSETPSSGFLNLLVLRMWSP